MKVDKRGRVRFGWRLKHGTRSYYTPLRVEVGQTGAVNITTRDQRWGEEGAPAVVYKELLGDRSFVSTLYKAQRLVQQSKIVRSFEIAAMS
jgi:hypothetical protein